MWLHLTSIAILLATLLAPRANGGSQADPPYFGTIFIAPDIITPSDPTSFVSLSSTGRGFRTMYDRRVNGWITVSAFLFEARYDDSLFIEIQVNPEFGMGEWAHLLAEKYAPIIGRLPKCLRKDVRTVWIHGGTEPFGGGNNNLLIHIGQASLYERDGILEEVFIHEAAHTSLDDEHSAAPEWFLAQVEDGEFISNYARDFPNREDIAESFLTWLAARHRADRISEGMQDTIFETIPNRLAYFDAQEFELHPMITPPTSVKPMFATHPLQTTLEQNYPNPFNPSTIIAYELTRGGHVRLSLFDLLGREVRMLVDESQPVGRYQVELAAADLPSGVYVYRLSVSDIVQTRKLQLIR